MFPCPHNLKQCPKSFSTNLGLRTHRGNCFLQKVVRRKNEIVFRNSLPKALGGTGARFASDDLLSQFVMTGGGEILLIPAEDDPYNLIEPSQNFHDILTDSAERKLARTLARLCQKAGKENINNLIKNLTDPDFNIRKF